MKSRIFDLGIDLRGAYAPLDRRYAERAAFQARVLYASEDGARLLKAEGALTDLSKSGCKIQGTVSPLEGSHVTLFLYLGDGQPPLCLTEATISWVRGSAFAAKFPDLTPEERKRIQELIWKHVTLSLSNPRRAGFRIV
ncbi:MAG: PilZ domain-containing protein [Nitrospira sp.]|nr:PilZ domain-containing protein [Nitrospira sp.]